MRRLARIFNYVFVITILWIGFILAISVVEAPLRFKAQGVTVVEALSIGRLVFHALNFIEIGFAVLLVASLCCGGTDSKRTNFLSVGVICILAAQTLILFTALDARTAAILRGEEVPKAIYHGLYVGLDGLKLLMLIALATLQIRQFEANARQQDSDSN